MSLRVFVLSVLSADGERFAIIDQDDWVQSAHRAMSPDRRRWFTVMEQYFEKLEALSETTLRRRLADMGLEEDAIAHQISRARNLAGMTHGASWEVVTEAGYRNEEGQEVVGRTRRVGHEPMQRVYAMRCTVCGHEYRTSGHTIPRRCCPRCQDGAPSE